MAEKETEKKGCTRRTALKIMAAGGAGVVLSAPLLSACNGNEKKAPARTPVYKAPVAEGDQITSRKWDRLGDTVGLLGMGMMRLPRANGPIDQETVNQMVDYCLQHGVNYFDTAPAYAGSEEATGIALSRHPRESYLIATKLSNHHTATDLQTGKTMFETSLQKLHTDYIDYLLLHAIGDWNSFNNRFINNGLLAWLQEQKKAGRIRHLGFSFHGGRQFFDDMIDRQSEYNWDFVQIQMNYLDWGDGRNEDNDTRHMYNRLAEADIPVVVMEPVRGGALANVPAALADMMADAHPELSPAGMALSFVGTFPDVLCVLSGMSTYDQVTENVMTFKDFQPLDDADLKLLENVVRLYNENPTIGCTGCRYCMPCPYGINIPGNLRLFDNCSSELNLPDPNGPHDKEYQRKRRIFLNRYKNKLDEKERAEFCIACGACRDKCPQRIDIPRQLDRIENLVKGLKK